MLASWETDLAREQEQGMLTLPPPEHLNPDLVAPLLQRIF